MSKAINKFLYSNNGLVFVLVLVDVFCLVLAFLTAYFFRNKGVFRVFLESVQPIEAYLKVLPFAILILIVVFVLGGLYEPKQRATKISEMYHVLKSVTLWVLLIMASSYLYKFDYSRIIVILTYFFTAIFIIVGRLIVRSLQTRLVESGFGRVNVLIVGAGNSGRQIAKRLNYYKDIGFNVVGFLDDRIKREGELLGNLAKFNKIIKKYNVQEVYIADSSLPREAILNLVARSSAHTKFKIVSNIFDLVTGSVDITNLEQIPSLDISRIRFPWWKKMYKQTFDILFAGVGLILSLPLWIIIIVAIKLDSKGPAILAQVRIGENGEPFKMYKFRTMKATTHLYNEAPEVKNDERITKIGRLIRRFSLDELPQFINILKGEMSVVGPRPEMPFIVKKYNYWERKRLEIKPGLTGLWQILGRKDLPLSENLEYDFYYINNQSFILDLVIILKTVPIVIQGRGAY